MDIDLPSTVTSGVLRLNAQTLASIFLLASTIDEFCRNDSPAVRLKTVRYISQVNHQWRAVALEQQELWLGVVLSVSWYSTSKWLELVLQRSYPLPLDLIVPPFAAPESVKSAFRQLPRIRNITLTARVHIEWLAEESRHHHKPLLLERFTMTVPHAAVYPGRRLARIDGPNPTFFGHAPMLQMLETHNYTLNLAPKLFHSLRILIVDITHRMSVLQLLENLRNMNQLEELHVAQPTEHDVLAPTTLMPLSRDEPLFKPSLKALSITTPSSVCAEILRTLSVRDSCSVLLRCRNAYNGRDLRDILSRLKRTITNWKCDELTGRQSVALSGTHARFAFRGPNGAAIYDGELPRSSIDLEVSWSSQDHFCAVFPKIASTFQSCKNPPETLELFSGADVPPSYRLVLHEWLMELDYLQAVEFHGHSAFDLYFPLLGSPDTRSSYLGIEASDLDGYLLPDLSDLIMVGVDFTSQKRLHWRRLLKMLRFRIKEQQPILLIDFVDCVGDFDQNIPGRLGVVVKVNGVDLRSDSEDEGEDSDYTVQGNSD